MPEDNWISYLEASSRSAIGGIADLGQVVGVTSTIIKNYGLSWDQAAAIQDKIQLTAKNGVTSFEQLAGALPKVTANAATLGISVNDLMASFATLTGVSGNTAEVATQLGAVMTALVKPSSEAAKIATQMGVQFDAAAIKAAGGFKAFLVSLDATIKAYAARTGQLEQEIYGRLFGSAEALRALIPLNGELADKFAVNIESMRESAGTMDAAFEDMADTEEAAAQRLKNSFTGLYDSISKLVSPVRPFLEIGLGALSAAANIGVLVSSAGALRTAFAGNVIVRAVQALGHAFDRSSIQALRMAVSARSAAMAANLCQKAMLGFGVLGGIGLLIWQLSESLDAYNVKARTAAEIEKDLNSIRSAAAARLVEQQQKIELLVQAAQNETLSLIERKKAVDELNRIIPDYNASLDATSGKYKANTQALQDYIAELTRLYEIEGAKDKLAEYGRRKVEINEQIETIRRETPATAPRSSEARPQTTQGGAAPGSILDLMGKSANAEASAQRIRKLELELTGIVNKERVITQKYGTEMQRQVITSEPGNTGNTGTGTVLNKDKGKKHKTAETPAPEGSIKYKEEQIRTLRTKLDIELDPEARQKLAVEIDRLQKEVDKMHLDAELPLRVADVTEKLSAVELDPIEVKADIKIDFEKQLARMRKDMAKFGKTTTGELLPALDGLRSMGSAIGNLGGLFDETGRSWANFAATTVSAIAEILPQLARLIGGHFAEAMAVGTASTAGLGFPAAIPAIAAIVASITSVMASVPKFAEGGIAYGPTLGLFGEYAGASRNPEVVAPLDRLRGMIADVVVGSAHPETDSGSERIVSRLTETVLGLETVSRTIQRSIESVDEVMVSESVRVSQLMSELTHSVSRVSETFRDFETVRQSVVVPVMTLTHSGLESVAASVPHFAAGGVVYGPTLGVMGEYAGAGSNPEIVAPLDRLRGIIDHTAGDTTPRNVTFTIEGSRLVGVFENYMRVAGKSGRRFNF